MPIHLTRDYVSQNTTTATRTFISSYVAAIFLRRVLGFSYVGDTNYPINDIGQLLIATGDSTPASTPTFAANTKAGISNNGSNVEVSIPVNVRGVSSADIGRILVLKSSLYPTRNSGLFVISGIQQGNSTTISASSDNVSLPTSTINVVSTTGFPSSGTLFIGPNASASPISTTTTSSQTLPVTTLNVSSTSGFPSSGTILVVSSAGVQSITYTGTTGGSFTGCSGGTGSVVSGNIVQSASTIQVNSTTGFTSSGTIKVLTRSGVQSVTYSGITATTFTGCSGLTSLVVTNGSVFSSNGIQTINYTGTTGTSFTGCTGGTGTLKTGEPVYNKNKFVIDYRSNGEQALVENDDTIPWYLYDKDINCPTNGAANSGTGYRGNGTSTTPRIILQSPHAMGWQIRICNETDTEWSVNFSTDRITFAPGFGGNSAGDFPVGGQHLHGALYSDASQNPFLYNTCNGCGDNVGAGPQYRYTMIGDDTGQSFHIIARRPSNAVNPESFYISFGFPDNEPSPLPPNNIERLFSFGNGLGNTNGIYMNQVSLSTGHYATQGRIQGASFKMNVGPISCSPSLLAYVYGNSQRNSPMFDSSAGDCPFISATELLPVDLVVGTVCNWHDSSQAVSFPFYPKVIGTLPIVKFGRANFGDYTLTTDTGTWNISNATNASPIQITTSTTNNLVTGQTVSITGVTGNTAANGTWVVTVINNTTFTLNGSTGNGSYISGGTVLRGASYQHMRNGIYIPWNGPAVVP
jgi:hypothetical protein